jgi:hypothetical protein
LCPSTIHHMMRPTSNVCMYVCMKFSLRFR